MVPNTFVSTTLLPYKMLVFIPTTTLFPRNSKSMDKTTLNDGIYFVAILDFFEAIFRTVISKLNSLVFAFIFTTLFPLIHFRSYFSHF